MDEKFLEEIRQQEKALKEAGIEISETRNDDSLEIAEPQDVEDNQFEQPTVEAPDGQQTLFGGGN